MTKGYALCFNVCPAHSHIKSISLDHEGGGTRLTTSKCCGRWVTMESFPMNASSLEAAAEALAKAAKELRRIAQ